jgi:hypothetical protein
MWRPEHGPDVHLDIGIFFALFWKQFHCSAKEDGCLWCVDLGIGTTRFCVTCRFLIVELGTTSVLTRLQAGRDVGREVVMKSKVMQQLKQRQI